MLKAQDRTLEGKTHEGNPDVLAPVLLEFFTHSTNQEQFMVVTCGEIK